MPKGVFKRIIGINCGLPTQGFQKGNIPTKEHCEKLSKASKGKKKSKKHCENISKGKKGKKPTKKHIEKMVATRMMNGSYKTGEENPLWVGDNIKNFHKWIEKKRGKASEHKCVDCDKQAHDWSNVDHKYSKNLDDYFSRCVSCHRKWDIKYNDYKVGANNKLKKKL